MEIIKYLLSLLLALLLAPLLSGVINKIKALFAGRRGTPVLQLYYDLWRLFGKDSVFSQTTSLLFKIAPAIIMGTTLAALLLLPVLPTNGDFAFTGDFILLFYLLALGRFLMILSALDTGSSFEGMGASREAFFATLTEPVAFIIILTVLRLNHTTSLIAAFDHPEPKNWIITLLIGLPMFVLILIENARIPFDDPTTHLELTMVHEVMILDHSGVDLAIMEYAGALKLWLFILIFVKIIFPFNMLGGFAVGFISLALIFITAVVIGIIESTMARSRLLKVPQLIYSAGVIACLGFYLSISNIIKW